MQPTKIYNKDNQKKLKIKSSIASRNTNVGYYLVIIRLTIIFESTQGKCVSVL